ncbi:hypothetical protein PC128_g17965, partial [Phytophthora cactorum]
MMLPLQWHRSKSRQLHKVPVVLAASARTSLAGINRPLSRR